MAQILSPIPPRRESDSFLTQSASHLFYGELLKDILGIKLTTRGEKQTNKTKHENNECCTSERKTSDLRSAAAAPLWWVSNVRQCGRHISCVQTNFLRFICFLSPSCSRLSRGGDGSQISFLAATPASRRRRTRRSLFLLHIHHYCYNSLESEPINAKQASNHGAAACWC